MDNKYEQEIITYVFEGKIEQFEIPYGNILGNRHDMTNPAQTESSPLAKVLVKSGE